jgi:hypothetical protein
MLAPRTTARRPRAGGGSDMRSPGRPCGLDMAPPTPRAATRTRRRSPNKRESSVVPSRARLHAGRAPGAQSAPHRRARGAPCSGACCVRCWLLVALAAAAAAQEPRSRVQDVVRAGGVLAVGGFVTLPAPFFDTACAAPWRAALARLHALPHELVLPGHGPPMTREASAATASRSSASTAPRARAARPKAAPAGWPTSGRCCLRRSSVRRPAC